MEPHPQASLSPFEHFRATRHFTSLDGLRCLAILPVIWHHATPRPLPGILGKGAVGVDLFFALSGFLITTLLLRERAKAGTVRLTSFFARRSLRIFPLYYATLLLYVVHAALLPESSATRSHFFRSLAYHATYTANWLVDYDVSHPILFAFSWTLCVEEQFYLVWPVLVALVRPRLVLALLMLTAVMVDALAEQGALRAVLADGSPSLRVVTSFATPIGLGSLLSLLLDTQRGFAVALRCLGSRAAAPALLLATVALLWLHDTPYLLLALTLSGLVAAVVTNASHGLSWLLDHPFMAHGGRLSYAAYLLHVTALGFVRRALPVEEDRSVVVFLAGLPITWVRAAGAHRLIERPCARLREKLR